MSKALPDTGFFPNAARGDTVTVLGGLSCMQYFVLRKWGVVSEDGLLKGPYVYTYIYRGTVRKHDGFEGVRDSVGFFFDRPNTLGRKENANPILAGGLDSTHRIILQVPEHRRPPGHLNFCRLHRTYSCPLRIPIFVLRRSFPELSTLICFCGAEPTATVD